MVPISVLIISVFFLNALNFIALVSRLNLGWIGLAIMAKMFNQKTFKCTKKRGNKH